MVRKPNLLVQLLFGNAPSRASYPIQLVRADDDVLALATRELSQLDEDDAARLRERGVAKTFGVEEKSAGGPVSVLVREYAVEDEYLLAARMVVRRERGMRLVAYDGRDLAALRRPDEVDALAPDGSAWAWRPMHSRSVDRHANRKITVD